MESQMFKMRQKFLDACLSIAHEEFKAKFFEPFQFQTLLMGASFLRGKGSTKAEKQYLEMTSDILDCLVDRGDLITNRHTKPKVYSVRCE